MSNETTVVVIGGGIAGISCIEALFQNHDKSNPQYNRVILISDNRLVKRVTNLESTGRYLERFDVYEGDIDELGSNVPDDLHFSSIIGFVKRVNSNDKTLVYKLNADKENSFDLTLSYDILCVCNGSNPRHLNYTERKESLKKEIGKRVIFIRDTNTVSELKKKLRHCRRLVIVGNGGIGLELVTKISDCEKIWIIRDESIGFTFFDSGAGKFLLDSAPSDISSNQINERNCIPYTASENISETNYGPALGPNWSQNLELKGNCFLSNKLDIIYRDEISDIIYISNQEYPLRVITRNAKQIDCDLVASAIGVLPNQLEIIGACLETSLSDGGILIDNQMRTSINHIYAAGDVVSCDKWPPNDLWFQMRLWTQARQMGHYAGKCIGCHTQEQDPSIYFNFDCFTHCTSFFGYKFVLLGKYNGQSLVQEGCGGFEVMVRVNPGKDYVKVLVNDNGRIIGAILIGDSGLEETIENLIYDQIDVSSYKEQLLDNTIDIEDYFD